MKGDFKIMKKNTMMRILSVLLVMTLISTCAISGTFAKYVTRAEGEDAARIAKWGILLTVEGNSAFEAQYETDEEEGYEGEYSVVSSGRINDLDKVVAPGTSNEPGLVATVMGTPEVATRYTLEIKDWEDIVLPAGSYKDYTNLIQNDQGEYGYFGEFELAKDYAPIKWDITVSNSNGRSIGLLSTAAQFLHLDEAQLQENGFHGFSASEAKLIMQQYSEPLANLLEQQVAGASNAKVEVLDDGTIRLSMDFDPNVEMDYTFALTWSWAFDGQMINITRQGPVMFEPEIVDMADTYLGNWIAGVDGLDAASAPHIEASLIATATQID